MSDQLIETIAKYSQIDRELHFPIQHMNNRILELMNRKYTYEKYLALVKKIRQQIPTVKISTDIIVGFPSETEDAFQEILAGIEEIKFF